MKCGVFIVPTGIGASIGGFAGDASKWARRIAKKCKLIVNPNVVNAACFSGITEDMLYVEGYTLDEFFKGKCFLEEHKNNKIGIIFDKSIPQDVINIHINTINAVKTVYDIERIDYYLTKDDVGVEFYVDEYGFSTGDVKNLNTIKEAGEKLLSQGAEAIAIVCRFPLEEDESYAKGIGVDPVGGVEAIISHYISKELQVPCAHAPAFDDYTIYPEIVNSKCAAEYITPTFLPCILLGLQNAPIISTMPNDTNISIDDVDFLIVPYSAMGSIPVLEMAKRNKKIYAVKENNTILNITPEKLNIKCDIIETYSEILEMI